METASHSNKKIAFNIQLLKAFAQSVAFVRDRLLKGNILSPSEALHTKAMQECQSFQCPLTVKEGHNSQQLTNFPDFFLFV